MEFIKQVNIGLRFLLELAVLLIWGYWGFYVGNNAIVRTILGMGTPLLAAVLWGAFGSPKAPYALNGRSRLILEIAIFGLPALALFGMGKQFMFLVYGIVALINLILVKIWKQ